MPLSSLLIFTNKLKKFSLIHWTPCHLNHSLSSGQLTSMPSWPSTIAYHTLLPLPYLWPCHYHKDSSSKSTNSNIFFDQSLHSTFCSIVLTLLSDYMGSA